MELTRFLVKLVTGIISIYDASNLQNRVYSIQIGDVVVYN
jgi:hypothetical protein